MKTLLYLLLLALATPAFAQNPTWNSLAVPPTTGDIAPNALVADQAGNLFVAGSFSGTATFGFTTLVSLGGRDAFVAKYSAINSAWTWAVAAGGSGDDAATAVALNQNRAIAGAVYVAGTFASPSVAFGAALLTNANGDDDAFVARIDDAGLVGTFLWATAIGSNGADVVSGVVGRSTSVYVAGSFAGASLQAGPVGLANGGSGGTTDGFVVKLNDLSTGGGVPRWAQAVAGPANDRVNAVLVRGSNLYLGGSFEGTALVGGSASLSSTGGSDAVVARITDNGLTSTFRWATPAGGSGNDAVTKFTASKNFLYVAGTFASSASFGSIGLNGGPATAFVAKMQRTGTAGTFNWALAPTSSSGSTFTVAAFTLRGLNLFVGGAYTGSPTFATTTLPATGIGATAPYVAKLTDQTNSGLWRGALAAGTSSGGLTALVGSPGRGFYAVGQVLPPATFGPFSIGSPVGQPTGFVAGIQDILPTNVIATNPLRNAVNAPVAGPVQVLFDQPVNRTNGSVNGLYVYGSEKVGLRTGGGSNSGAASTITHTPSGGFRPGEQVQVSISYEIQSTSGAAAAPQVFQFRTAAGGSGQGRLRPMGNPVAVGDSPSRVLLADVNGDGILDALSNTRFGGGVSVQLGDGRGHFTGGSRSTTGASDSDIAVGDIDGDGDLDLVFANNANATLGLVSVRLNNGSGTFSTNPANDVPVNDQATSLVLADVNADGDLDLLVSAQTNFSGLPDATVGVHLGDGTGSFLTTLADVSVGSIPVRLAAADVNDDGKLDLITANAGQNTLSVRLGDGQGGFITSSVGAEIPVTDPATRLAVADLNGDGHVDLISAADNGGGPATISIRLGDGASQFTNAPDILLPQQLTDFSLADVDADGILDLTIATNGRLVVYKGLGTGSFTAPAAGSLLGGASIDTDALATGDIDNDGDLDAVTVGTGPTSTVQALLNTPLVAPDLVVSTTTTVPADFYNNVTVTGTGTGSLVNDISVDGTLLIQSGGTLNDNCHLITGSGDFLLAAGGTLRICDPAGLTPTPTASGTVQVTGRRFFSPFASYAYTSQSGGAGPATGAALPSQVRDLTVNTGATKLRLTSAVAVRRALTLAATSPTGGLAVAAFPLTLRSDADSTALVVNTQGTVAGTATVQRAVGRGGYQGRGYRHYSAPVAGATVGSLTVPGVFTPDVSQGAAYNSSPTPGAVTPFPTVFGYNEGRVGTVTSSFSAFDKGWLAPTSLADPLTTGHGYTVNLPAATVAFTGALRTGDQPAQALTRSSASADAGWALVGNPYPAPLDWSLVAPADRPGLDGAMYVFEPGSQYGGSYRSYANNVGNPVLPLGQGFFVRVAAGQPSGSLTFRDAQRLTSFDPTAFRRGSADTRPQLRLALQGRTGPADALILYAQTGATPGYDGEFDAHKLANPSGLGLAAVSTTGELLSIQGLPAFTSATVVPLTVRVPAPGAYALKLDALANVPATTAVYLTDALTGLRQDVRALPPTGYAFTLNAAQAAAPVAGRFALSMQSAATALANATQSISPAVTLFPNPAHGTTTVWLPGTTSGPVQLTLLDALGRRVLARTATVPPTGLALPLNVAGLPAGVYALRLHTAAGQVVKRLVVE